jgi:hypothetical protein
MRFVLQYKRVIHTHLGVLDRDGAARDAVLAAVRAFVGRLVRGGS